MRRSDDGPALRRRALLGGLTAGVAGLAGCTTTIPGFGGGDDDPPGNNSTDQDGSGTPSGDGDSAWGRNIPTYPYRPTGVDPLNPKPDPDALNPVLGARDVTDVGAEYVADPFIFVTENDEWHMFFEVKADRGVIAHATSDDRGVSWSYDRVVLRRPYHMSMPYVFKWEGTHYMTTAETTPMVRLYRAKSFPTEWESADNLYNSTSFGPNTNDHVLFRWEDRWWSLAGARNNSLHAFYADTLTGEWKAHENNPVVDGRPTAARPGGRPIVRDDHVLFFYQDVKEFYGAKVRAYRITDLTPSSFSDEEVKQSPVIQGTGEKQSDGEPTWNSVRMHHYDPWYLGEGEGWRVAVDGNGDDGWAIGIYRVPEN